jgi:hypothetical protein
VAAGDGEATWLASGVIAGKLRCSSGEDEGTKRGGGFWRSFLDGRFGTDDGELNTTARVSIFVGQNLL